jgi:hypothetical protein
VQLLETVGLGVQAVVHRGAPADDLTKQAALGGVVLGDLVVELVPDPERRAQVLLGRGDGGGVRG